ncbi:MAG: hypothetical protein JKX94_03565 [Sneathiella sp.]|nr:hypothetical protein [Sneathiella sp.]
MPLLIILFVAGCGATTKSASVKSIITEPVAKTEKVEPVVAALPQKVIEETEKEEPHHDIPVPRVKIPEVSVLMGKSTNEIEQVFGRPVLQRKDKPAEIWQYLTSECALHLVFYPSKTEEGDALTVQHVSMNERKAAVGADSHRCFGSQLRKVGDDRIQALG